MIPLFSIVGDATVKVDARFMLIRPTKSGTLFPAPIVLVPFLLDKALRSHLPRSASMLVYPSALATIELVCSLTFGTLSSIGERQYTLQPLVMTTSVFGLAGVSFLIGWSASVAHPHFLRQAARRGIDLPHERASGVATDDLRSIRLPALLSCCGVPGRACRVGCSENSPHTELTGYVAILTAVLTGLRNMEMM